VTARRFARLPRSPRFTPLFVAVALSAALSAVSAARGEPTATSVYARDAGSGGSPAAAQESPAAQAERILAGALVAFDRAASVQIKFRQKARIGSRVLKGGGLYLQSGTGEEQRYRFESILNADTETFETIDVGDGVNAWSYRRLGSDPPRVERMDVRRVRERLAQFGPPGEGSVSRYLGGLQRSLWTARQWFVFQAATPAETEEGLPVWVLEGHWHPDHLATLQPALREAAARPGGVLPEELPDGMPWRIRVEVARGDLLPRRVEYLAIPGPRPVGSGQPEPIAVLDLFDISVGGPVDASAFLYRPAPELGLSDVTDAYVGVMGPMRP
jgi:hypothetical protein